MFRAMFRILAGFVVSCLVAGLATVAFVITPAELASLAGTALSDRLTSFGTLALLAVTHSAIFAAPFALIAAVIGEWQSIRNPMYYATAGVAIALAGFAAQYSSETGAAASIANNYALKAFLTSGFFSGLAYWLVAGRGAGGGAADNDDKDVSARRKVEAMPPATGSVPNVIKPSPSPNSGAKSAAPPSSSGTRTA